MKIGLVTVALAASGFFAARSVAIADPAPVTVTVTTTVEGTADGWPASRWAARSRSWHRRFLQANRNANARARTVRRLRRVQARRWAGTVDYGLRLASAVYGVPYSKMRAVAYCESTLSPFAQNGRYKGLFQLGWSPFGFSPFDPVASALSAAQTVVHDGSWRQWTCGGA